MNSISVYYTVLVSLFFFFFFLTVYFIDCSPVGPESILVIINYFSASIVSLLPIILDSTLYVQLKNVITL